MTFNPGDTLFYILLAAPLLAGLAGFGLTQKGRKALFLAEIPLLAAGALSLGLLGERQILTPLAFMGEPIHFSISLTGIMLFLGALLALAVLYGLEASADKSVSLLGYTLVQLSLAAGFLALMSGQFLIRYIALDLVGLFAALSILKGFDSGERLKKFISIFQMLRLGDLCLLAAILLINVHAGTLDISRMIAAAAEMPLPGRTWALMGFILAVLIKQAVPPLGAWQRHAHLGASRIGFWISGILMPVLGSYLLYRIVPLLLSTVAYQIALQGLSLSLFALIFLAAWINPDRNDRFIRLNALMACFGLGAAATPGTGFLGYYLVGMVLIRLAALLHDGRRNTAVGWGLWGLSAGANALFLWVNASTWPFHTLAIWVVLSGVLLIWLWRDLFARKWIEPQGQPMKAIDRFADWEDGLRWLHQKLEKRLFSQGFSIISRDLTRAAVWLKDHIEGGFEKAWSGVSRGLVRASKATLATLEEKPAARTEGLVEEALEGLARYEQNVLKKTLRWDLALIPLFLAAIIVLLFIV